MRTPEYVAAVNRRSYLNHREERIAKAKTYYEANREHVNERRRAKRAADPSARERDRARYWAEREVRLERTRRWRRAHLTEERAGQHGMTADEYDALRASQGNRCVICQRPFVGLTPHVDHDHTTGAVRGLLCRNCNVGIGHLRDDPSLVLAAYAYLTNAAERAPHVKSAIEKGVIAA